MHERTENRRTELFGYKTIRTLRLKSVCYVFVLCLFVSQANEWKKGYCCCSFQYLQNWLHVGVTSTQNCTFKSRMNSDHLKKSCSAPSMQNNAVLSLGVHVATHIRKSLSNLSKFNALRQYRICCNWLTHFVDGVGVFFSFGKNIALPFYLLRNAHGPIDGKITSQLPLNARFQTSHRKKKFNNKLRVDHCLSTTSK